MRISGNEPSSVILSQTKWFQTMKMIARKFQVTTAIQLMWLSQFTGSQLSH